MRMTGRGIAKWVAVGTMLALVTVASACGSAANTASAQSGTSSTPTSSQTTKSAPAAAAGTTTGMTVAEAESTDAVTIPGDYFLPLAAVVHAGDTVTWLNKDTSLHTLVTYPGAPASFHINVAAGQTGSFTFSTPGVYRYYGERDATYKSEANIQGSAAPMKDVEANPGADLYPAPMRGVIVVLGADGSLPASGTATVDIPDSTMDFTPYALVVPAGSTVTFTNHDGMPHAVTPLPGYATANFATFVVKGDGGRATATFDTAGVYYYCCPLHARWDTAHQQLVPLKAYGSYPFVMDGLVVVTPK